MPLRSMAMSFSNSFMLKKRKRKVNFVIPRKKKDGQMLLCGSTAKSKGLLKYINFQVSSRKLMFYLQNVIKYIHWTTYYTSVHSSLIMLSYVSFHLSRTIGVVETSDISVDWKPCSDIRLFAIKRTRAKGNTPTFHKSYTFQKKWMGYFTKAPT